MSMGAVIFDLDDTLYAEQGYAFSGFAIVARTFQDQLGDPADSQERMQALFFSDQRHRVFNVLLEERGVDGDQTLIDQIVSTFRSHSPKIELFADADAALTRLRPRFRLGLITDGPLVQQSAKVAALNLRDRLDEVILTSELGSGKKKPHPAAFEEIARRLGVAHDACVYVADNPSKDFVAPNQLGWLTIQVERPGGVYLNAPVAKGGLPKHIVTNLDQIDALIA